MTSARNDSTPDDSEPDRAGVAVREPDPLDPEPTGWPEWSLSRDDDTASGEGRDEDRDEDQAPVADKGWWQIPTAPQSVVDPSQTVEPARRGGVPIVGLVIALALAVIAAFATVSLVRLVNDSDRGTRGTRGAPARVPGAGGPSATGSPSVTAPPNAVSSPLGVIGSAEFQLVAGVTAVVVRAADIGDDLYRAATPDGSGFVPVVTVDGALVRLRLARAGTGDGPASVTIDLNARVRWQVSMLGGSESSTVDLRAADLAGVDLTGGVARIEMWLPKPLGVVPIRMSGGARDFVIHAPDRVPVRVQLARGAAKVTVDGSTRSGIASGTRITPPGWERAPDRYDVDAIAGLAVLTVDRY